MRTELIKDAVLGILKKTLPINLVQHFLTPEELAEVEYSLKQAKDKALMKAKDEKPWPGVEAHNAPKVEAPIKSYVPAGGFAPHYSDSKPLRVYKHLMKEFATAEIPHHGHIDFNPKEDKLIVHSDLGKQMIHKMSNGAVNLDKPKEAPSEPTAPSTIPVFGDHD